jgi:uncharacterized pyridoxamine 5'-phosphate oxidase family protein
MNRKEIINFINQNPVFSLATADHDVPHVRDMTLIRADKEGIVFCTRKTKDLFEQLSINPRVELCFYSPSQKRQVRISGNAEINNDPMLKKNILLRYPYLNILIEKQGDDAIVIYQITHGRAIEWTMKENVGPKEFVAL